MNRPSPTMNHTPFSQMRRNLLLTPLFATGLGTTLARAQSAGGQVVVYATPGAQSVEAMTDAVHQALGNVKVEVVTGASENLLKRVQAEAASPRADLFWTVPTSTMERYRDYFAPYRSPEHAAVVSDYVAPDSLWAAANVHVLLLMVNTTQLRGDAPTSWQDLTDPRFKGKIIVPDPANSSAGSITLWGIEKNLGPEVLRKLAANCVVTPSGSNAVRTIGQGEYAVAIAYETVAYPYIAGKQRGIRLVYPQEGVFVVPDHMAIIKNAPNAAAARRVYDAILSRDAQIALLENAFRRPSRTDIDVSRIVEMPELGNLKPLAFDERAAAADFPAFLARWKALPKATDK